MEKNTFRLHFIDVIRAFAISMMLQGHFIDGLLSNSYRDTSNVFFNMWLFFRGITAPVFFTVSGFIFMFLLLREEEKHPENPFHIRSVKGIRRGFFLIFTAYVLRLHFPSFLFHGEIYANTYLVDVLHCIGLSLLFLIAIYLFSFRQRRALPIILISCTLILFSFSPIYSQLSYDYLPTILANYFTTARGSVFTIFPWFGYASFGAFTGYLFYRYKNHAQLYSRAILICLTMGIFLSLFANNFFQLLFEATHCSVFKLLVYKNSIFNRLGNVLLVFVCFMLLRNILTSKTLRSIGQNTLSIYVIHYIILYGSFTGTGLYQFFHHKLSVKEAVIGALLFTVLTIWLSMIYHKLKSLLSKYRISLKDRFFHVFQQNIFSKLKVLRRGRI